MSALRRETALQLRQGHFIGVVITPPKQLFIFFSNIFTVSTVTVHSIKK